KLPYAGTVQQCLKRIRRSHPVAAEKLWMCGPRTDKIVAAIARGPDNYVVRGECLERPHKYGRWQVWAVAVECDDALPASCREVCERRGEACRKALTLLRHNAHSITRQAR